jgi:hypothetical protein
MDLALPVPGRPDTRLAGRETPGSPLRLVERRRPRPAQLKASGPVDQAGPGEVEHLGLRPAPPDEGVGPLPGPPHLEDLLAGADHLAVDEAGEQRGGQLSGEHGDHRLVQQRHPLGHEPLPDPDPALDVQRERDEVGVAGTARRSPR